MRHTTTPCPGSWFRSRERGSRLCHLSDYDGLAHELEQIKDRPAVKG